jgi:hypothetical protein
MNKTISLMQIRRIIELLHKVAVLFIYAVVYDGALCGGFMGTLWLVFTYLIGNILRHNVCMDWAQLATD